MIPVRVRAGAVAPVVASASDFRLRPEHVLFSEPCPVCSIALGARRTVLVFVGIAPENRKDQGWVNGAAVCVHSDCAGV